MEHEPDDTTDPRESVSPDGETAAEGAPPRGASARASAWLAELRGTAAASEIRLVLGQDGANYVVEGTMRRKLTSPLILAALEKRFGARTLVTDPELNALAEGPPVVVMKAPQVAPFVVVGGKRLAINGIPLIHGVKAEETAGFEEGDVLDVRPRLRSLDASALPPLPTFLIVGAQKSATRWLRMNLGAHPEVCVARTELGYFLQADATPGATDAYRARFEAWTGEKIVGEATPGYMMWRLDPAMIASRIKTTVPDVRILAILRNPVDRAYSALLHHIERGRIPHGTDLVEYVRGRDPTADPLSIISGGWYAASLAPYYERFPGRVLVLLQEDIATKPLSVYESACRHIGTSVDYVPSELTKVRHSNKGSGVPDVTPEAREILYPFFREDVRQLEELTGLDLRHWDPSFVDGAS